MNRFEVENRLLEHISKLRFTLPNLRWYKFGSWVRSDFWNDIDILVIYEFEDDIRKIDEHLGPFRFQAPFHFLYLTANEERELSFINAQDAKYLGSEY